jgi:rRNA-processing protein FCF1
LKNIVLDENIILLAAKAKDTDGNPDYTCFSILLQILQECDYALYCSTELMKKYQTKLNDLEKINKSATFTSDLVKHLQRNRKIKLQTYLPNLPCEEEVPRKDIFLIRLAAINQSTVITTDCRLKDKLITKDLISKFGIFIKHPKDFNRI